MTRQEEHDAYEGVAAVVTCRVDDATVAFAADDGSHFLHLCGDIDLAHSSCKVLASVLLSDIAQGAGRAEVRDCSQSTRIILITQNIICHRYQGVFLAEHGAVFADKGQTVDIGVDNDTQVDRPDASCP